MGFLEEYDLDYGMAVIKVDLHSLDDVHCLRLEHQVESCFGKEVIALGRRTNGTLMNAYGELTGSRGSEDGEHPMTSTCQLSEVYLHWYACYNVLCYYCNVFCILNKKMSM